MGIANDHGFEWVYQRYLAWHQEQSIPGTPPKDKENLLQYQIFHEDIYENRGILLNRMYFLIPLSPSQSKRGIWENFQFSELNLLVKSPADGEITHILPVEYRTE